MQPLLQLVLETATGRLCLRCGPCRRETLVDPDDADRSSLVAAFVAEHAPCAWPAAPAAGAPA